MISRAVAIAAKKQNLDDLEALQSDPRFRRATKNMILTTACAQGLLDKVPNISKNDVALVVGTIFGEVASSLEFLKNYKEANVASPTLFQNSLHNSTLGFVSLNLQLTGPAITISNGKNTAQAALELAETLQQVRPFVLVCWEDVVPESHVKYYSEVFPTEAERFGECRGILLTSSIKAAEFKLQTLSVKELEQCFS